MDYVAMIYRLYSKLSLPNMLISKIVFINHIFLQQAKPKHSKALYDLLKVWVQLQNST